MVAMGLGRPAHQLGEICTEHKAQNNGLEENTGVFEHVGEEWLDDCDTESENQETTRGNEGQEGKEGE